MFVAVFTAYWLTLGPRTTNIETTVQAWAFWHGRIAIDGIALAHESVVGSGGWHYLISPPLGAALLAPLCGVSGTKVNQTLAAAFLGALSAGMAARLTRSAGLGLLWAFGTVVWYEATTGDSWGLNIVLSTIPTMLALEAVGENRWAAVGWWAGVACLARFDTAAVLPVYGVLAWLG